jgi:hypothetical protein
MLRRSVPLKPTATQVLGLGQTTPTREVVVPLGWRRQVRPPSVLRTIVLLPPMGVLHVATATQVLGLGQATPIRLVSVPLSG